MQYPVVSNTILAAWMLQSSLKSSHRVEQRFHEVYFSHGVFFAAALIQNGLTRQYSNRAD